MSQRVLAAIVLYGTLTDEAPGTNDENLVGNAQDLLCLLLDDQHELAPTALLHNLKHNKVLHEQNVILTVVTANTPRVEDNRRVTIMPISPRFSHVTLKFGYMETPNVPKALAIARKEGLHFDIMSTSFFLSRRSLKPSAHSGMPRWQDRLFIGLARSANDASDFFRIPTGRVVEVGHAGDGITLLGRLAV